jgi:DNA repair protein RadC
MGKIKDLPLNERPRERLVKKGVSALSDAELIAIILRTGTQKGNVLELSLQLLKKFDLKSLSRINITRLKQIFGIGEAKACQIAACFELGRRLAVSKNENMQKISNPRDILALISPKLENQEKEHLIGIYLNSRRKILREEIIFIGTLDASLIHPREIFKVALEESAAAVILVHNHPSGNLKPSLEDIEITKELVAAGNSLGIRLLDHIIICGKKYFSMREKGIID